MEEFKTVRIFGMPLRRRMSNIEQSISYLLLEPFHISSIVAVCLLRNYQAIFNRHLNSYDWYTNNPWDFDRDVINSLQGIELAHIHDNIIALRDSTVRTPWMQREIDKITSMFYFLIVISFFLLAVIFVTYFPHIFGTTFQADSQFVADITALGSTAKIIIYSFSSVAIFTVLYKIYKRSSHLKSYAFTTFLYLLERKAIEIERTNFSAGLQEIERYLDNSDWPLADLSIRQLMEDYADLIRNSLKKREEQKNSSGAGIG